MYILIYVTRMIELLAEIVTCKAINHAHLDKMITHGFEVLL